MEFLAAQSWSRDCICLTWPLGVIPARHPDQEVEPWVPEAYMGRLHDKIRSNLGAGSYLLRQRFDRVREMHLTVVLQCDSLKIFCKQLKE